MGPPVARNRQGCSGLVSASSTAGQNFSGATVYRFYAVGEGGLRALY